MTHLSDSSSATPLVVGIDVAKDKLDLATSATEAVSQFDNTQAGIAKIVKQMIEAKPAMIVIESTGGLERPLLHALLEVDLPAALVHPGRVRNMAKGLGILAKTDKIDAAVLVAFGQKANPRLAAKASENQIVLRDLVACRGQLAASRAQQYNRRSTTTNKAALKAVNSVIATMDRQIEKLEKQIADLINADDEFKGLSDLLRTVPGVGPVLAATLIADVPELGKTDRQQVGAVVGVAPYAADSGTMKGQRQISGGRVDVRGVLYMATVCALKHNKVIKVFADRLKAAGKRPKVVIVACMRKLLSLLNAMAHHRLTWLELDVVKKLVPTA